MYWLLNFDGHRIVLAFWVVANARPDFTLSMGTFWDIISLNVTSVVTDSLLGRSHLAPGIRGTLDEQGMEG